MTGTRRKSHTVLQVSDCHVSSDAKAKYRGQSPDQNLKKLLTAMRVRDPELILLTGDASEDASAASYARVSTWLGTIAAPVVALPGNHDDPEVMQQYFRMGPWRGPREKRLGPWLLVMMDSTEPGKISGSFRQQELERLDEILRSSDAEHVLLAMHHQPVPVDAPWIDRYALESPSLFFNFIDRDRRIRCIVWGHVHHDFSSQRKDVVLLGAPSTAANSLPRSQRFTLDLDGPSFRWLELNADGTVNTGIQRPL